MKTLLILMNVVAFIVSFGAILWAWMKVRKDMRDNAALLDRLKEIEREYANEPAEPFGGGDRRQEKREQQLAAGKTMFTYGDLANMPELVKHLIYSHALNGLALQVWLVGLGLAVSTAANVLSLFLPTGD
ncbi:hypothetical protein [Pseudarthrobacter sp. NCCP-2145]|uniref:hypothetical protein n=1 Tax=Pseudarthrobacter sp. NCCP-2145 TaxID=2942290 RepID=UPI00203B9A0A|nr:hypothetical protein [Pseudarthrobacter sp. NCCP-2145]